MSAKGEGILTNSFSLYDDIVVKKCLQRLRCDCDAVINVDTDEDNAENSEASKFLDELIVSVKMSCTTCCVDFASRHQQVLHYKESWHCYNLKRKLQHKDPISETDFMQRAGVYKGDSELSSDSSSTSADEMQPLSFSSSQQNRQKSDRIFFKNELNVAFSIYTCLVLHRKETVSSDLNFVERIMMLPEFTNLAVVMLGGGHFAAAVFNRNDVVVHKTFHRYVIRAKQGSSQSKHDGSRHATSGGASLRRYNETALREECQSLLSSWKNLLDACQLVFYRIPKQNRAVLFEGKPMVFAKEDSRLRTIPFQTKRPTFQEVVQVHRKLTQVACHGRKVNMDVNVKTDMDSVQVEPKKDCSSVVDKTSTPANKSTSSTSSPKKQKKTKTKLNKVPKSKDKVVTEELPATTTIIQHASGHQDFDKTAVEVRQEVRNSLYTACKLGNSDVLAQLLRGTGRHNNNVEDICSYQKMVEDVAKSRSFGRGKSTLLHIATKAGHPDVVRQLLEFGCDPSLPDQKDGTVPYEVANNAKTERIFQRFMADFPDKYDYRKAKVPKALTLAEENAIIERQRQKEERRDQLKKAKEAELNEMKAFRSMSDKDKVLAVASRTCILRCWTCAVSLEAKTPFEYSDFKFCSIVCLKEHRSAATTKK